MLKTLIILLLTLSLAACDLKRCSKKGEHDSYNYYNNSSRTLEVLTLYNYPDTTILDDYDPLDDYYDPIPPYTTTDIIRPGPRYDVCVEDDFENGREVWLYFLDHDSLVKLSWDTVRMTRRGILERRKVDLRVLQENNFVLTYQE